MCCTEGIVALAVVRGGCFIEFVIEYRSLTYPFTLCWIHESLNNVQHRRILVLSLANSNMHEISQC